MTPGKKPGWYVRVDMHQTLGFWDGNAWTNQTAPSYRNIEPSVMTIAGGVALGCLLVAVLATLVKLFVNL